MRNRLEHPAVIALLGAIGLLAGALGWTATSATRAEAPGNRAGSGTGAGKGRGATTPSRIPPAGWWAIGKRVAGRVSEDRLLKEAAGVTFYGLLAIFPALTALISLYGLVADPRTVAEHLVSLEGVLPGGGIDIIKEQVATLTAGPPKALGFGVVLGLATALWSANQGTKALFDALNVVNEEKESRGFLRLTATSLAFTLGALVFVLLALVGIVAVPVVLRFVGLGGVAHTLLDLARWPVLLGAVGLFLSVLYRWGPSRARAKWRWVTWGSGFAALCWLGGSAAFSWYVAHFGSYNKTYGSLGAAVGFMTWIWISTIIVLVGGELNAEMEHQTGRDTTRGPDRPRGRRGAAMADRPAAG